MDVVEIFDVIEDDEGDEEKMFEILDGIEILCWFIIKMVMNEFVIKREHCFRFDIITITFTAEENHKI